MRTFFHSFFWDRFLIVFLLTLDRFFIVFSSSQAQLWGVPGGPDFDKLTVPDFPLKIPLRNPSNRPKSMISDSGRELCDSGPFFDGFSLTVFS